MRISFQHISFRYDRALVLKKITADIEQGELVALVGPNGSGKSTLIKCVNGILKLQEGRILLNGQDIRLYRPVDLARNMAYVPQSEPLGGSMPVFDTVLMGRKPYIQWKPASNDIENTARVLSRLELDEVAMRPVRTLSGGQQQRVFIARALNQNPRVLLLDEPTANLDLRYQMEVMDVLRSLTLEGITVIIAMHDINLASAFASRILMLKEGTLFADGGKEIVTAQNVQKLFGVKLQVLRNNGNAFILPASNA